jgi:hypothetical protein
VTPSLHSRDDDRQGSPTSSGYYRLAEDGADVEAPQSRNQGLNDLYRNNATYCSGNRVSGA